VLSVHAVKAVREVLDRVEEHLPPARGTIVFHWFSGSPAEAVRAVALGCFFSINGEMLSAPKRVHLVRQLPRDRLLTETDGPFVKRNDVPVRPASVAETSSRLAEVLGLSHDELSSLLCRNLRTVLAAGAQP
jgi:TatD DNase family protein